MLSTSLRTVVPDGTELQRRREEAKFSQEELAAHTGYSPRTIKAIEAGKQCFRKTLQHIATVLKCTLEDLLIDNRHPPMATMNEALDSMGNDIAESRESMRRLIFSLDHAARPEIVELELLLLLAIRRDVLGDASGAIVLARLIVDEIPEDQTELLGRATVRLASFYDHEGRAAEGLRLLDRFLRQYPESNRQYWWALFQQGTLLVSNREFDRASKLLRRIWEEAPEKSHRLAAMHQLGVIDLELGRLREAENWFMLCLEERKQQQENFRIVYEYRRLAEVYSKAHEPKKAKAALARARSLIKAYSFARYEQKLKRN
jgi:transcriptional regulator with XRE-family HTH domain